MHTSGNIVSQQENEQYHKKQSQVDNKTSSKAHYLLQVTQQH